MFHLKIIFIINKNDYFYSSDSCTPDVVAETMDDKSHDDNEFITEIERL